MFVNEPANLAGTGTGIQGEARTKAVRYLKGVIRYSRFGLVCNRYVLPLLCLPLLFSPLYNFGTLGWLSIFNSALAIYMLLVLILPEFRRNIVPATELAEIRRLGDEIASLWEQLDDLCQAVGWNTAMESMEGVRLNAGIDALVQQQKTVADSRIG